MNQENWESAWSKWQGYLGKRSWGKGMEAPRLEKFLGVCGGGEVYGGAMYTEWTWQHFGLLIGTTVNQLSWVSLGLDTGFQWILVGGADFWPLLQLNRVCVSTQGCLAPFLERGIDVREGPTDLWVLSTSSPSHCSDSGYLLLSHLH